MKHVVRPKPGDTVVIHIPKSPKTKYVLNVDTTSIVEQSHLDFVANTADAAGISLTRILGKDRNHELVNIRFYLAYHLRNTHKLTLKSIANLLNFKDHTTVLYAIKKYNQFVEVKDDKFLGTIKKLAHVQDKN